ncbi:PKD domain-containing protein [Mucilaginibacter lutimaris]|uniref:PKD domain-containing protein n=1 Tax=Mucilaginibacter lutimaris TaxID=931629 RepID=A0ABW2ZFD0_9SPHI
MGKTFIKALFILLLPLLVITAASSAQTITVGAVDAGPYGPGSSISVPFTVTGSCISNPANKFNLYLSNAAGTFGAGETLIGSYTGFYATFVNGIIPATAAGSNYRVQVRSTLPVINSASSNTFSISALPGLKAGASSNQINAAVDPDIFGSCVGSNNRNYTFTNTSDGGNPATATFFNELSQTSEGTIPLNGVFMAKAANYTVTVKTSNAAGITGTKSYQLINNVANNSFTITGNGSVCLGAGNTLEYNVDITGNTGIQNNYPGLIYNIKWGDGTASTFTLCQIIAANGKVSHAYITSSCGNVTNNQKNVFQIDIQPTSPYCTNLTQPVTTYAKVLAQPQNRFDAPVAACLGSPVTFSNNSIPGDDPNSTASDCRNIAATYTWLVDGVVVATGRPLTAPLTHTFTTSGNHDITLRFENNSGLCDAPDLTKQVCIQKAPVPNFTIPAIYCLTSGPLPVVNTSVVDEVCNTNTIYKWNLVSGPATGVTFAANAKTPNFTFTQAGVYQFRLDITTLSCGTVTGPVKEIIVNATPTVTLSPDADQCGKGVTLDFNPSATVTKTTLTGTAQPLPTTYVWTVASESGGTFSFANGTTANSQYPSITFNDYGTYTITATHTNSCGGPVSASQKITFVAAPTVSAGPPQNNICEGTPVNLSGTPGVGGLVTAVKWTSSTGGTFTTPNSPNATYTPSAADINAGQVLLTYTATTSLAAPCNQISSTVLITIVKKATVTSSNAQSVCSGGQFTYTIRSADPATTFTWTTALTSGTATGFGATGSGATINDVITNSTASDAVVTYTITPTLNGCTGTPFALKVTIQPLPVLTQPVPVDPEICSNQPANIPLNSNIASTTYTWTSTAGGPGISGNTNLTTASAVTGIQDVLVNTSALPGTVTYTVTPYNGTCAGTPKQVTITVKPLPKQSIPGPNESICAATTYTLKGNDPSPGIGQWTVTSGQTGVTFSGGGTSPNAVASGLIPGQVYKFTWTISAAPTCPSNSATVTITNDLQTVPGTTTGSTAVCAGSNNGTVTLTGYVGNIVRWERSIDGGINWLPIANTTPAQDYLNLTQTTQYRAVVQSGSCSIEVSTVSTVTVNQPVIASNAGPDQPVCNTPTVTLDGNDPLTFGGTWTQVAGPTAGVVITDPTNPKTTVTGLAGGNNYTFRWTINGTAPCASSSDDVDIIDRPDVPPNFTQNRISGCGPTTVQFTNTSPTFPGVIYAWDFGDGSPVSNEVSPIHTFQPDASGRDVIYIVKLTTTVNCTAQPPHTQKITIHPATPTPRIFPDKTTGCGGFTLTVENTSRANYVNFRYVLLDENGNIMQERQTSDSAYHAQFNVTAPLNPKTYKVKLIVTDFCGNTGESPSIDIKANPLDIKSGMFVTDYNNKCFPVIVNLHNNSTGGNNFQFHITSTDGFSQLVPVGLDGTIPYAFPKAGIYNISITASNSCGIATPTDPNDWRIDVFEKPRPDFKANTPSGGCGNLDVTFTNTTIPDASTQPEALAYEWDFGDGSPLGHQYSGFVHTYSAAGTYTVTLTATNTTTGCFDVIVKTNVITVYPKPIADFTASPGFTTAIPNYRFTFTDATTMSKPVKWDWDFGDGQTATGRNVNHTYGDVGKFNVTLNIVDDKGCTSTITKAVEITGTPGFLFLPNAFQPSGDVTDLQRFMAKGSGIAKWQLQIFNNWGQLIWQTTALGGNGEPTEGWDGTFKGAPVQQGVYVWQASATFINGTEWKGMSYNGSLPKRSGYIHLLR